MWFGCRSVTLHSFSIWKSRLPFALTICGIVTRPPNGNNISREHALPNTGDPRTSFPLINLSLRRHSISPRASHQYQTACLSRSCRECQPGRTTVPIWAFLHQPKGSTHTKHCKTPTVLLQLSSAYATLRVATVPSPTCLYRLFHFRRLRCRSGRECGRRRID